MSARPPCLAFRTLLWSLLVCCVAGQSYPWYLIDSQSVVCVDSTPEGAPGFVSVDVDIGTAIAATDQRSPHVFTFYRTTNESVSITFSVRDSLNKPVIKSQTITLQGFSQRRLVADESFRIEGEEEVPVDGFADVDAFIASESQAEIRGRQLGARRRSGGARPAPSRSPPRRRAPSRNPPRRRAPRSPPPRRRGTSGGPNARRRANPAAARRRGPAPTSPQPQQGVGGSRFQNSNGQAYSYSSPGRMNSNYPGGHSGTGYGYSGGQAYRPNTGMGMGTKMALAAGGGLVLGVGAAYMYSRWTSYDCRSDSWSGNCNDCYRQSRRSCRPNQLDEGANRDDLMDTGFWPNDWKSPLIVKITSLAGADFMAGVICPPAPNWNISAGQDLFMTLTKVAELGDELAKDGNSQGQSEEGGFLSSLVSLVLLCCCCGGIAMCVAFCCKAMRGQQHQPGYEDGYPPQGGYPPQYPPQYGQPQYAQDPYQQQMYQGGPQYAQQPVMMGQPVGMNQGPPMGQVVAVGGQPQGGFQPQPGYQEGYQPQQGYQPGAPVQGYQPGMPG